MNSQFPMHWCLHEVPCKNCVHNYHRPLRTACKVWKHASVKFILCSDDSFCFRHHPTKVSMLASHFDSFSHLVSTVSIEPSILLIAAQGPAQLALTAANRARFCVSYLSLLANHCLTLIQYSFSLASWQTNQLNQSLAIPVLWKVGGGRGARERCFEDQELAVPYQTRKPWRRLF